MNVVVLVVLIFLVSVAVPAAVLIPLVRSWKRGSDRFLEELRASAAASGERFVAGPDKALYRGGGAPYGSVKGNGTIVLTDRRLLFRKLTGGMVEIPTQNITGVRRSASFRRSRVGGATHLVVATTDPTEVGFFVPDIDAWQRAIEASRPR